MKAGLQGKKRAGLLAQSPDFRIIWATISIGNQTMSALNQGHLSIAHSPMHGVISSSLIQRLKL